MAELHPRGQRFAVRRVQNEEEPVVSVIGIQHELEGITGWCRREAVTEDSGYAQERSG